MDIIDISVSSVPLSTSYEGDEDILLKSRLDTTEDGLSFFREDHLNQLVDRRINNYSCLYLTNKQNASNFLNISKLEYSVPNIFTTSLQESTSAKYLTVQSLSTYSFTEKDQYFVDPNDTLFEIELLNSLSATISRRYNGSIYYLSVSGNSIFTISTSRYSIFNYILDKQNNKLSLFYNLSVVGVSGGQLLLDATLSSFKHNYFNINYYLQVLNPRLNTSWVSYSADHKNSYEINPLKSRNDLENNYLISNQYSYITGNTINANILTLKNQTSNKNYSNRSDYMELRNDLVPSVDCREYTALFTGNEQEKGDHSINLSYEFYNADYKFKSDKYTVFTTPESLYPYEQINVNDLKWKDIGAIAGDNPYVTDKIFRKKIEDGSTGGQYLCTWLFHNKRGENIWLDRYYYPDKTSYSSALSTTFDSVYTDPVKRLLNTTLSSGDYYDVLDPYNTYEEELANTPQTISSALYGRSIFDKKSDMVFVPNQDYIYYRIGAKYVSSILTGLINNIIQDGLVLKNENDAIVESDNASTTEYVLNGRNSAQISNYFPANSAHQFTLSFWLKSDDWTSGFGHQILGNLNNKGFAVFSDRKVTPLITIQHENKVHVFNTDFVELDYASLENESSFSASGKIKDIQRKDHLDAFSTILID